MRRTYFNLIIIIIGNKRSNMEYGDAQETDPCIVRTFRLNVWHQVTFCLPDQNRLLFLSLN